MVWVVVTNFLVPGSFVFAAVHVGLVIMSYKSPIRQMLFTVLQLFISIWMGKCYTFKGQSLENGKISREIYSFTKGAELAWLNSGNRAQRLEPTEYIQHGVRFVALCYMMRAHLGLPFDWGSSMISLGRFDLNKTVHLEVPQERNAIRFHKPNGMWKPNGILRGMHVTGKSLLGLFHARSVSFTLTLFWATFIIIIRHNGLSQRILPPHSQPLN